MSGRGGQRGRGYTRGQVSLPHQPSRGGHGETGQQHRGVSRGTARGDRGDRGRGRGGGTLDVQIFGGSDVPIPDAAVLRIENETQKSAQSSSKKTLPQKQTEPNFPHRPGYGTLGRPVVLRTNYFDMLAYGNLVLKRYVVKVTRDRTGSNPAGKKLRRVIQLFLEEHLAHHKPNIVTDFKSTLLSKATLLQEELDRSVIYRSEGEDEPSPTAGSYRIQLQPAGTVTISDLVDHLTSTQASRLLASKDEITQALNIVVGYKPKVDNDITSIGPNRHFNHAASAERFSLGAGLTALRGFFVSVRASTARLLVNVQVKHGAFYNDGPLTHLMAAFLAENGQSLTRLANFIKRLSIDATHISKKNKAGNRVPRIKTIAGLATKDDGQGETHPPIVPNSGAGPKEVKFFLKDQPPEVTHAESSKGAGNKKERATKSAKERPAKGRYVSVYDYFKQTYSITIADPRLPVINVGSRERPSYLPAQVCSVLAGQPSRSKLSASQTQQMIRFAVRKPVQNAESIMMSGVRTLSFEPDDSHLATFGLGVVPKLITVPGRVLTGPEVKYHGAASVTSRFGSWNMQGVRFSTGANLSHWTYLWISEQGMVDPWSNDLALKSSIDAFTSALRSVGVNASDWLPGLHIRVDRDNTEAEIDNAFHKFSSSSKRDPPNMVLVILPSSGNTIIYNRVKYTCDVREGLLNVCVVASKFAKANAQYHTNVALKVNLKLGGRNQYLDNAKLGVLPEGKTMVVGIDVTHPSPGSSSDAPSVAGIVASVDRWLGQWPADLRIQTGRQEMVADLSGMLESRLQLWSKKNPTLPENILIYRDGVSEGQYNLVLEHELPALRQACKQIYPARSTAMGLPHMAIIVVGKRHNTRFYPTKKEDADRSSNPQNGTVVDRRVTEARNWDFFLQAHAAIQGTARPAHYFIIYDEIFRASQSRPPGRSSADTLQDLTHNLCYMFGRATKAVSICPPAYYADLVCERARCYLAKVFDPSPSDVSSTGADSQHADTDDILVHARARNSMFYI